MTKDTVMTRAELRELFHPKPGYDVHEVWHEFGRRFLRQVKVGRPVKLGRKIVYQTKEVWRWKGWDLMQRVERWAAKWPTEVEIVGCDDGFHASSRLVLIQHRELKGAHYHGTTVVFIPQCTGEDPSRFFLYQGHHKEFLAALRTIQKLHHSRKR